MSFIWSLSSNGLIRSACEGKAQVPPDSFFAWVHLDLLDPKANAWLSEHADIPLIARRAMAAHETRPRTQPMDPGALINLRGLGANPDEEPDALVSIRCWVEKGRVVTASLHKLRAIDAVERKMEMGKLRDPGDLIAALAAFITDDLDPDIAELGDALDECEAAMDGKNVYVMRRKVGSARARAIALRRFVAPQRQALERLALLEADWLEDSDRAHLREAADRCARMAEELEAVRERAALMHEQLTDLHAEMMDSRALLISVVALIFLPLTFITGLLGMNVPLPLAQTVASFWWVLGACGAVALTITAYFVARHWFRS